MGYDSIAIVPFGSRVYSDGGLRDPYYEVTEWYLDGAPQVTYLDGEEGRYSIVEGGTTQYAYGNTAYLDILGNIPRVDIYIQDVRTVNPPTDEEMQELLGDENPAVQVSCTSDESHAAQKYALKSGSYETASQMDGNSVDNYPYTITVNPNAYVAEYDKTTGKEHHDAAPASQKIVFEFVAGEWTVQTKTPVTFNVTCEDSKIPDVDVDELGDKVVTIQCINTAAGHEVMNVGILGAENTDYTVAYSEEKTSATITIKSANEYVKAYNAEHGKPEHTASQISDATIKVKYNETAKEWVIDSSDNTATVDVTCEDTAVTSVDLEKTITQVKRGNEVFAGQNIPQMLKVGDEITYQINVTNTGDVNLDGLTVTDAFTGNNKPSEGDGITWTGVAGNWTCTISNIELPAGEAKTYKYTYTVVDADKGNTITNAATVKDDGDDPIDEDEIKTEVENPAVGVEKSLVQVKRGEEIFLAEKGTIPEELEVGDELTYAIEVKNIGNVKLNGLTLTDTFNGHFAPSKVKDKVDNVELTNEWEKDTTTGRWTLKIENISPDVGEIETYTYTYIVNQADAGNKLTNTAVVTGDELDPDDPDKEDEDEHEVTNDGDITLQPADITIYMGGEDGYAGAAGGDSKSLPEPGFYITLPADVEKALQDAGYSNGEAADLSDFITGVTATTADGQTRSWTMQMYGESASTAWINNQKHFVYRIVPGTNQPKISVNFTKEDGTPVTEDKFTLTDSLSETYFMSLNTASVDVETISLTFNINGEIFHCGYDAKNSQKGTLTVRYASEEHDTTKAVTSENNLNPDTSA